MKTGSRIHCYFKGKQKERVGSQIPDNDVRDEAESYETVTW